jgi:2-amino-4-hydroxy-6-hydroxymethyldihydropteridine diphosphokinase
MPLVFVGAGSNLDPEANLRGAIAELARAFGELDVSSVYRSRSLGFEGPDFLNLVIAFETDAPPAEVELRLHEIEHGLGRRRDGPRFSSRSIDLDLLMYGDQVIDEGRLVVPRPEVLDHPFVLKPLAELDGERLHPVLRRPLAELSKEIAVAPGAMEIVDIEGIGRAFRRAR